MIWAALAALSCSPDRQFSQGGEAGQSSVDGGRGGDTPTGGDEPSAGGDASGSSAGGSASGGAQGMMTEGGAPGEAEGGASSADSGGSSNPVDPCAVDDPCVNGGVCTAEGEQAVCTCDPAYEGDFCEKNVDDCAAKPCSNGGTCIDGNGSYSCTCLDGFSGLRCERAVSGCDDAPCLNGSTCAAQGSGYKCSCKAGYGGTNCETDVNECSSSPCKNGGACKDGVNSFMCSCKDGYTGSTCETNVNECAPNPCKNGGTCTDGVNTYTCSCKLGYSGTNCQTNINECANSPCQNGGTCVDGVNAYSCSCTSTYTGTKCEYLEFKLVPSTFLNGAYATTATALSNDGKVLLMNLSDSGGAQGFGRLVDFESANAVNLSSPFLRGAGYGIDDDGSTMAGEAVADDRDQAIKVVGTAATLLNLTPIPWQNPNSAGLDVSADGTTVVGRLSSLGGTTTFYCKAGQACREVPLGASEIVMSANSVNGNGTVVVGHTYPADPAGKGSAWRWVTSDAKATSLGLGAATWAFPQANAVSRDGLVVVGKVEINGVTRAVRWSGSSLTPTDLGNGMALGTNADGSVTVGADNTNAPVVWFGTTRQTLASLLGSNPDLNGATLKGLVAVSDDGKVVAGTATVAGKDRAFMARLP